MSNEVRKQKQKHNMSNRALPNPGLCHVTTNGKIVIYKADSGAWCAAIPCQLVNSEVAWAGKYTATIIKSDGTVQSKTIANLKSIFGWDGLDPFALEEIEPGSITFEGTGEHSPYTPEGEAEPVDTFKLQWINPIGGSARMPEPVAANDRKAMLAEFGSKFKAISGSSKPAANRPAKEAQGGLSGTPSPEKKKAAASGPPGRRGATPSKQPRSLTVEEAWGLYMKKFPNAEEQTAEGQKLQDAWYEAQDKVRLGANSDMTPEEWGQVCDVVGI